MDVAELSNAARFDRKRYCAHGRSEQVACGSHDFMLVLPLDHGRIKAEREDWVVHDGAVQPGMIRVVQPGERSRLTPGSTFESVILTLPSDIFKAIARKHRRRGLDLCPIVQPRRDVQRFIPLLRTLSEQEARHDDLLVSGLLLVLIALVLDAEVHPEAKQAFGFEDEEFEAALAFAGSRLSKHLDLSKWAEAVGLSTAEFARRFQQHTGVAPYTWFMDRRIDEAKRLMRDSDMPLVEVALDSGFCSQSHFTEAFRRRVGASPGRWRTTHSRPRH